MANSKPPAAKRSKRGDTKVTQREKEIEAWWQIDSLKSIDDADKTQLQGASRVVKAFLEYSKVQDFVEEDRKLSHDLTRTRAVLGSYMQFVTVKNEHDDWDVGKLRPCDLVDRMWKVHSGLTDYKRDMKLLCGRAVEYRGFSSYSISFNSDEVSNDTITAEIARVNAAVEAIQTRYGSVNESVWGTFSVSFDRLDICEFGEDEESIFETPYLFRDKSTSLSELFEEWAMGEGICRDDFRFFLAEHELLGSCVDDSATARGIRLDIYVLPKDPNTPTYFRLVFGDADMSPFEYSHLETDMLSLTMEEYAEDCGVEKSALVFLHNGKRIYGFEQPRQLGMMRCDTIQVVPADSYKNDRCICCNPSKELFKVG